MADRRDDSGAAGQQAVYQLAGPIRYAFQNCRWIFTGGEDDETGTTLFVIVQAPDSEEMIRRYKVRVPIRVDGDDLVIGDPEVTEL